ncbi:hypothetical protein MBANPS3_001402 [Mucor bainieri]
MTNMLKPSTKEEKAKEGTGSKSPQSAYSNLPQRIDSGRIQDNIRFQDKNKATHSTFRVGQDDSVKAMPMSFQKLFYPVAYIILTH